MVDGKLVQSVELEPGLEVWIGGVTLVAESSRLAALRAYLGRLLGWTTDRVRAIDIALRSIRAATTRQAAIVLCADHDPELIARALHRHVFPSDRPFVMCDPGRKRVEENVRAAVNYQRGMEAIAAAKHGTVCIWSKHVPKDFAEMKVALQDPDTRVVLMVCAYQPFEAEAFGATPIAIPSLRDRVAELPQIVDEYAQEASEELGLPRSTFTREDRDWVIQHAAASLSDIEKSTLRFLAIREAGGNMTTAASRLGMARWPLTRWAKRHKLPMRTSDE